MKDITTRDLKESLLLLSGKDINDGEGGFKVIWDRGPRIWASLWPLESPDTFHNEDLGGPMASHIGYQRTHPAPRYRLIMRSGIHLRPKTAFLWKLYQVTKRLTVVTTPVHIQNNQFLRMIVVETENA